MIVDTGPLVAVIDEDDQHHQECDDLLTNSTSPLLMPAPVMVEVCYMVERQKDSHAEAQFLRSIRDGEIELVDLLPEDIDRIAQLVDKYADFPLGAVDASVIAVAERLRVNQIATLDRRHFAAVKLRYGMVLELLPH